MDASKGPLFAACFMKIAVQQRPDPGTGGENKEQALQKGLGFGRNTIHKAKAR